MKKSILFILLSVSCCVATMAQSTLATLTPDEQKIIQNLLNNMVLVQGGTFSMGSFAGQPGADQDETPAHQVTLSNFYIGKYEVTQEEWEVVMGSNPSYLIGAKNPVERISWDDCEEFLTRLSELTGRKFRFPTEAEWEYAAIGGSQSQGYTFSGNNKINAVAWYEDNSGFKSHAVGGKDPNELGLYDMSGNVMEWCQDWYGSYDAASQVNPVGPTDGEYRVARGGSWNFKENDCRAKLRNYGPPMTRRYFIGLRLAASE